jgi:arylsulfatase A-like enzyme
MKPSIGAQAATDRALAVLKRQRDQDVFLMLHYWDVHTPYDLSNEQFADEMLSRSLSEETRDPRVVLEQMCLPDGFKRWTLNQVIREATSTEELIAQHCASLRTVDEQIGRLYRFIRDSRLLNDTVFVVTGDHGENLFERGYFIEHSGIYENVVHVPLIMHLPGIKPSHIGQVVSHVDIVPTLTDYLGLQPGPYVDGLSLLPLATQQGSIDREYVYFQSRRSEPGARHGVVDHRYKYVETIDADVPICKYCGKQHVPSTELYDLMQDGGEAHNLVDSRTDLVGQLRERLERVTEGMARKREMIELGTSRVSEISYSKDEQLELDRRFRNLGYID